MNQYIQRIQEISINNKYSKYYCSIIENALKRPQNRLLLCEEFGYVELHHILPKSFKLGGEKEINNLVFLTAKEHFIVHLCAIKMFDGVFRSKMIFAFRRLKSCNKFQNRYVNSKIYAKIKPDFKNFIRLYKKDQVKYFYESEVDEINILLIDGWNTEMTEEYKIGRVGCMLGKKHTEETKRKMSEASKGKSKLYLIGKKRSQETINKQLETLNRNKIDNPEKYQESILRGAKKREDKYKNGILKPALGMLGKKHNENTKQKISESNRESWKRIKENELEYDKLLEQKSIEGLKRWENPDLKERAKIFNSSAHKKHGINPLDYYNQKLKPLLYLGFLPTSIVKYGLLDMTKGSIKRLIREWGTNEDLLQFEENKKHAVGANKLYKKFLEDQYIKIINTNQL